MKQLVAALIAVATIVAAGGAMSLTTSGLAFADGHQAPAAHHRTR